MGWLARVASLALVVGATGAAPAGQERAREFARQSIREYEIGAFDRALADAAEAYELSGAPELLFNLGQCHRALAHWKEALFSYRNYLRRRPEAKNRVQVLALIEEMRARQRETPSLAGAAAAPFLPATAPSRAAATTPPAAAPVSGAAMAAPVGTSGAVVAPAPLRAAPSGVEPEAHATAGEGKGTRSGSLASAEEGASRCCGR